MKPALSIPLLTSPIDSLPGRPEAVNAVLSMMGSKGNVMAGAFQQMRIAEEEIASAKKLSPPRAGEIHDAFILLCPSPILEDFGEDLYRIHAREILERIIRGEDPEWATDAEVMAALYQTSMKAPLNQNAVALYFRLFTRWWPSFLPEGMTELDLPREEWAGAMNELEWEIRRGLTMRLPWRNPTVKSRKPQKYMKYWKKEKP